MILKKICWGLATLFLFFTGGMIIQALFMGMGWDGVFAVFKVAVGFWLLGHIFGHFGMGRSREAVLNRIRPQMSGPKGKLP